MILQIIVTYIYEITLEDFLSCYLWIFLAQNDFTDYRLCYCVKIDSVGKRLENCRLYISQDSSFEKKNQEL